jgi:hypothetical protein
MVGTRAAIRRHVLGTAGSFRAALRRDATLEWGIPAGLAEALFLLPVIGGAIVTLAYLERPVFRFLTEEDSVLEWAQFLGYASGAVFAVAVARALQRRRRPVHAALWTLFGVGCLLVAGEEISWGQRIFGWATPAALDAVNHQHETTVHNIGGVQLTFNAILLVGGLYGAVAPLLVRWRGAGQLSAETLLLVPGLFLVSAFLVLFAYKLARLTFFPRPRFGAVEWGEWAEFCLAYACAAFAGLAGARLRAWSAVAGAPAWADAAPLPATRDGAGSLR